MTCFLLGGWNPSRIAHLPESLVCFLAAVSLYRIVQIELLAYCASKNSIQHKEKKLESI